MTPILIKRTGMMMETAELKERRVVLHFFRKTAYI